MDFGGLLLLAFGLSLDCVAAVVSPTLRTRAWYVPLCFAFFQTAFLTLGSLLGNEVVGRFESYGPWIAFVLLVGLGVASLRKIGDAVDDQGPAHTGRAMAWLLASAVGTSIDALAAGTSISFADNAGWRAAITVFVVTAVLVALGLFFAARLRRWPGFRRFPLVGALIFFALAGKTLWEHRSHLW